MPGITKDAFSVAAGSADLAGNEVPGSHPGPAAGAEIPVTVHASRYSAVSKAAGKLPPVHEETRTVIILPQGAVVRLSATVSVGELVVLTNKRTGADVICRVTSVKTQPGIQNYVHLEFTQRAPDFWEDNFPAGRATSGSNTGVVATLPPEEPPAPKPMAVANRTPSPPVQQVESAGKVSPPSLEVKPARVPVPKITPLADLPAGHSEEVSAKPLATQSLSDIPTTPVIARNEQPVLPPHNLRLQPFQTTIPQGMRTSKIVLFSIAAVVLLAVSIVVGAMLLRGDGGTIAVSQFVTSPSTPLPAASKSEIPVFNTSGKASSLGPPANVSAKNPPAIPLEEPAPVTAAVEPAKPEAEPAVHRPAINVGQISKPKLKKTARLDSSEPPPVLPPDANALPVVTTEGVANITPQASPMPPAALAVPAPVKGGQLQQPKLLSSVAAVYPPLARAQRVQGDVTIDALIDATGKVAATNVLTGNPLLQKAAMESLRFWKYQPALLNGQPIPIHINVTISFRLN
jgi:protein TonB